jgi:DNA-binding PucR family transcriptional regulator
LGRSLREAELVARLVEDGAVDAVGATSGTWWLLVRTALRGPADLAAVVADTLGALERPAGAGASELLPTFAAYVSNGCNMNATAAALPAHRHTVAHRLDRVRVLTGLDPLVPEDRERLGVALKARAVLAASRSAAAAQR